MVSGPWIFPGSFKWNGGQYALEMVGLLIALTAVISVSFFRVQRKGRESIAGPTAQLLAHWTYAPAEWAAFVGEDFKRERANKWSLFRVVAAICVVIGAFFWVMDPDGGGAWVLVVLLALLLVIVVAIVISTRVLRKSRSRGKPEVRIAENGLLLGTELHLWKGWAARLEACEVIDGQPPCIEFIYSTPAKNQRQINSVRVPIPTGFDGEAAEIVAHFVQKLRAPS